MFSQCMIMNFNNHSADIEQISCYYCYELPTCNILLWLPPQFIALSGYPKLCCYWEFILITGWVGTGALWGWRGVAVDLKFWFKFGLHDEFFNTMQAPAYLKGNARLEPINPF